MTIKQLFLSEKVTLSVVLLNVVVIFLQECGLENAILASIDIICTILFLIEMALKQRHKGFSNYWHDKWDILDGSITLISLPSLLVYFLQHQIHIGKTILAYHFVFLAFFSHNILNCTLFIRRIPYTYDKKTDNGAS